MDVMMLGCLLLEQQHGRLLVVCEVGCIILKCWGGGAMGLRQQEEVSWGVKHKNIFFLYIFI